MKKRQNIETKNAFTPNKYICLTLMDCSHLACNEKVSQKEKKKRKRRHVIKIIIIIN